MPPDPTNLSRPATLAEVAARSTTLGEFGRHLQDWLHTLRGLSTRGRVAAAIRDEPPLLAQQFPDGDAADAWLAAYAELIATKLGLEPPRWAFDSARTRLDPWFAETVSHPDVRRAALLRAPLPFKRRNLYAARVDLPLRVRPGRPTVSLEQKRRRNAERQRRFRARRAGELQRLREIARAN